MNRANALKWFEEVEKQVPSFSNGAARTGSRPRRSIDPYAGMRGGDGSEDDGGESEAEDVRRSREYLTFSVGAEQAIERVFPPGDPVVRRWKSTFCAGDTGALTRESSVLAGIAIFREAHSILRSDRFATLMDGVRADTVGELIDQAVALHASGLSSAAMVTAGGALEITLRHLCEGATPPVEIDGHGSIEKWNSAIQRRRNEGYELLTLSQSKAVTTWGGLRNDAAHDPIKFGQEQTKEGLRLTIDGIRQFILALSSK